MSWNPFKRISSQILVSIWGCSILTAALVGGFFLYEGARFIRSEAEEKLIQTTVAHANQFSQTIERTESTVDAIQSFVLATIDLPEFIKDQGYMDSYDGVIDEYLRQLSLQPTDAIGLYVTFNPVLTEQIHEIWYSDISDDNNFQRVDSELYSQYMIIEEDWVYPEASLFTPDQEGMEYLYETMERGVPIWFDPYVELGLDITALSFVKPLIKDGVTFGVVGVDINIENIKKLIEGLQIYENGYAFLLNLEKAVVIHPDYNETISLEELHLIDSELFEAKLQSASSGIMMSKDETKLIGFARLSNQWIMMIVPPYREIMSPVNDMNLMILGLTFIAILIAVFIAYLMSLRLSGSMEVAVEQLHYLELGDFTKEIPAEFLKRDDDIGHFIQSVHTMQKIIKDLVNELESLHSEKEFSSFISHTFRETKRATNSAAIAIEQIALESENKDVNLRESLQALARMNETLQQNVQREVEKNRRKDAAIIYHSRQAKMGEMVAIIAHQWRQPLNNLNLLLSNLGESFKYNELNDQLLFSHLEKAERIIMNLSKTIIDFQNFLNPDKEKEWFSILECTRFAVEMMEETLHANHIPLVWKDCEDSQCWGFSNEYIQVIANILSNSRDALMEIPENERRIEIAINRESNKPDITILNSGPPISSEIAENIFDIHFTTKVQRSGTGIGLYMSKTIIEDRLNGTIAFMNRENGVLWQITLPENHLGEKTNE